MKAPETIVMKLSLEDDDSTETLTGFPVILKKAPVT